MRLLSRPCAAAFGCALLLQAWPAHAVVVNDLPYGLPGAVNPATKSPAWTVVVFSGTSMTVGGGASTLTTANSRGVWFGHYNAQGISNTPAWTLGNSVSGNYLSLNARFSATARDWSAYLYDGSHMAFFNFAPTSGCNVNNGTCYGATPYAGVSVAHGAPGNAATYAETLVPVDLSQPHQFEWLLKNGQVSYRIDNRLVYSGAALARSSGALLVIGDGSGSTLTGTGSMTITGVTVDTAPAAMTLVPEPATAGLWAGGLLALAGWARRRQRAAPAASAAG